MAGAASAPRRSARPFRGFVSRDEPGRELASRCRKLNGAHCARRGEWTACPAMWLALLLAAAPAEAARAHSLLTYVAADYAAAVGDGGEVLSRLELDEQRLFAGDAADDLRAAGANDLASGTEQLIAKIAAAAAPREVVPLAQALGARVAQRLR